VSLEKEHAGGENKRDGREGAILLAKAEIRYGMKVPTSNSDIHGLFNGIEIGT
jgi:hypothetical protein